ncbi:Selenoprotein Sep15/SelM [Trinorchestia longiramus]|nr:Selenoprotein Sep15/SelM [Trinorchestia longiramus]
MHLRMSLLLVVVVWSTTARADETIDEEEIAYATIESCSGCQLYRFPQAKKFIDEDVPLYDRVKRVLVPNAFPAIVYHNKHHQEIDRVYIRYMTQEQSNTLLMEKGFRKKENPDVVPKKRNEVPKKRDVVPEKRDGVPEKLDVVPEKCDVDSEKLDVDSEKHNVAPEKRQQDSSDKAKEEL